MISLHSKIETWPIAGEFRISRSRLTKITVVTVEAKYGKLSGFGECRPYSRYNETPELICAQIASLNDKWDSLNIDTLQNYLPAGAARNAVDCALWDLKAQRELKSVPEMMALEPAKAVRTAYTLSIDTPPMMQAAAVNAEDYTLLKIKISDLYQGISAAKAVMDARPDVELIIDANEALSFEQTVELRDALSHFPVLIVEQPLHAETSNVSFDPKCLPIICADESLHTSEDLVTLWREGYRAVNIKLDKTGGLTEAARLIKQAKSMGFVIMLGCMVGTSLAISPAMYLSRYADIVDLDGPVLLSKDRAVSMRYENGCVFPPPLELWGNPRGKRRQL